MTVNAINTQSIAGSLPGRQGAGDRTADPSPAAGSLRPLGARDRVPGSRAPGGRHEQLVEQAQKWVAQTFYGQLLKQMRASPFKSDLFSGGRGGEAFGGLFDQQLADRMSRGAGNKLVNGIVRRMEARSAYAPRQPSLPAQDNPFANVRIHVPASPGT